MIRLEPRPAPSAAAVWLSPLAAALATVAVGLALFAALGKDPWTALAAFFVEPVATR